MLAGTLEFDPSSTKSTEIGIRCLELRRSQRWCYPGVGQTQSREVQVLFCEDGERYGIQVILQGTYTIHSDYVFRGSLMILLLRWLEWNKN